MSSDAEQSARSRNPKSHKRVNKSSNQAKKSRRRSRTPVAHTEEDAESDPEETQSSLRPARKSRRNRVIEDDGKHLPALAAADASAEASSSGRTWPISPPAPWDTTGDTPVAHNELDRRESGPHQQPSQGAEVRGWHATAVLNLMR